MLKTKIIFASMTVFLAGALANATCAETPTSFNARKLDLAGNVLVTTVSGKGASQKTDTEESSMKLANKKVQKFLLDYANDNSSETLSKTFISADAEAFVIIRNLNTCKVSVLGTDGEDIDGSNLVKVSQRSLTINSKGRNIVTINKIEN